MPKPTKQRQKELLMTVQDIIVYPFQAQHCENCEEKLATTEIKLNIPSLLGVQTHIGCYCGDCYQDIVLTLSDSLNYGITT